MNNSDMKETAAEALIAYMAETGLDQTEVAEKVGVTKGTITHIIRKRLKVSSDLAAEFERKCGIPAEKMRPDTFHGLTAKPAL